MFVPAKNAQVFKKTGYIVREYGGTKRLDIGLATITNRYPKDGWAKNRVSDMTYFVVKGKGTVWVGHDSFRVKKGDLVLIERGKWYRAQGIMDVLMASSPAWNPKQYEEKS